MGMSRCYSLMKCLLIIFCIIFLIVGSGVCGVAGWALWEGRGAGGGGAARAGLGALAAWGGALAAGGAAGALGAARDAPASLAAALALLALSAVAEAAAAAWGAAHRPQLRRALLDALEHTVRHEYGVVPSRTQLLDVIQQELRCCGASGARDWRASEWGRRRGGGAAGDAPLDLSVAAPAAPYWVPASCCRAAAACEGAARVAGAGGGAALHGGGCGAAVLPALERLARAPLLLGGALLAAHALALPLTLALALRAHTRRDYKA